MKIWFRQHASAIRQALVQFYRSPGHFFFNILVLSMTLVLPFGGMTILDNIQSITEQLSVSPEISVFLKKDIHRDRIAEIEHAIHGIMQTDHQKAEVVFISKETALESLQKKTGLNEIADSLGRNPLPDAYIIRLPDNMPSRAELTMQIESAVNQLQKLPGIDKVQIDSDWTKRLAALLSVLRMSLLFLAMILSIVVIVVIFNTVRLQVLMHINEITLSWHVGASRAYIRRPFYYMGFFLGLFSGFFALVLIDLSLIPFNSAIYELAQLYGSDFQLVPLNPVISAVLLGTSSALGWFGALLSVNRQLKRIY